MSEVDQQVMSSRDSNPAATKTREGVTDIQRERDRQRETERQIA